MQLTQSTSMRQEMRQLLTPRMIQSMEILQLPLALLEERIEQEMQQNPVLELKEPDPDAMPAPEADEMGAPEADGERALVVDESDNSSDFERLAKISEYLENEEWSPVPPGPGHRTSSYDGERDKKLDAMANTAARDGTLQEHLIRQWAFIEAPAPVHAAGTTLINYVDEDGYIRTDLETIQQESKTPHTLEDLQQALKLLQTLEPTGVGARSLKECLLLQLDAVEREAEEEDLDVHDFELERRLITDHLKDLEMNRYPQISKKLGRPIEDLKAAVRRLGRLDPHPGKRIGSADAPPIIPDATIYFDEETGRYEIEMARDPSSEIGINAMYRKMLKDKSCDKQTREFLTNNVRNARWLIESIEQRSSTIKRVIRAVVDAQQEFFEKGPEYLKPLPMIQVADQLGIHVATVSRAVSEKYIQTPRGIFPLRRFFSGGTTNAEGEDMSWDAVKEKLKVIIDNEDKHNPLNDDEIVEKLKEQGIDLARRTVAKYRKILNIPTARQRKEY